MKARRNDNRIPKSFQEACKQKEWDKAIDREFEALTERDSWKSVPVSDATGTPFPFL